MGFPIPAKASVVLQVGDPAASSFNQLYSGQFLVTPSDGLTHTLAGIAVNLATDNPNIFSEDLKLQLRRTTGGAVWKDCFSESINASSIPYYGGNTNDPDGIYVQVNFSGTDCSMTGGQGWFVYPMYVSQTDSFAPTTGNVYANGTDADGRDSIVVTDTPFPPDNTSTRIDTVEPPDGSIVATSTPTFVGAAGYINEDDWKTGTRLRIKVDKNTDVLQVGALAGFNNAFGNYTDLSITTSGEFDLSTTTIEALTNGNRVGIYSVRIVVQAPKYNFFGYNILYEDVIATSTKFTYGTTTIADHISTSGEGALAQILAAGGNPLDGCTFDMTSVLDLTVGSDLLNCVVGLVSYIVLPDKNQITALVQYGRESLMLKAPWGYGVRVYDIVTQPIATSSLPSLGFTIPAGPMEGTSIDFTPWDKLAGPGSFIAEYESPYTENNFLTQALLAWNTLCLAVFGFWLVQRLVHSQSASKSSHQSV